MKVYRGPSSKDFYDGGHELVDTKEISRCDHIPPWHGTTRIRVNITKENYERGAVAHIDLEPDDIVVLHENLIKGLMNRSEELDVAKKIIKKLETALQEIRYIADKKPYHQDQDQSQLELIRDAANTAISALTEMTNGLIW